MSSSHVSHLSVTPSVGKQTQQRDFGEVLKETLKSGAATLGTVSGVLGGGVPGGGMVSAAVSAVSSFANQGGTATASRAATGVVAVGSGTPTAASGIDAAVPQGMNGMVSQMRAEADRSIALQMQMQQESRDYNTLTNVLKTRHDSAKSAINNIR